MIPVYGFLEGDSLGLLILGDEDETVESLALKLKNSAKVRVRVREGGRLIVKGATLNPRLKLSETGLQPLDRFDVVWST